MSRFTRTVCGVMIGLLAVAATAQEQDLSLIDDVSAAPTEPAVPNGDDPAKRRSAMAGLAAVAGITIIGIGLVAVTVLWAGRLRRLNRQPLPEAPLKNELWFLKPPKSPPDALPPSDSPT